MRSVKAYLYLIFAIILYLLLYPFVLIYKTLEEVKPMRKFNKWVPTISVNEKGKEYNNNLCPKCGKSTIIQYNYCPNCGKRLKKGTN